MYHIMLVLGLQTCQLVNRELPVPGHTLLQTPPSIVLSALRKELGGGVGRDSSPQTEDALPLLYLLPTQKPEHTHAV